MSWIQTRHGRHFSLLEPRYHQVDLRDIAHALGNLCRFTGHSKRFYSVAEHSLNVAAVCETLSQTDSSTPATLRRAWLIGALHDAHEAYTGDIATPLKEILQPAIGVIETKAQEAIHLALEVEPLTPEETAIVKIADMMCLHTEACALIDESVYRSWHWLDGYQPADIEIRALHPEIAATYFLSAVKSALNGRRARGRART